MSPHAQSNRSRMKASEWPHDGQPSVFTCPDCQGTLFLIDHDGVARFRCRIGHLYSPESMHEAQTDNVERLLWSTVRALYEQAEYEDELARLAKKMNSRMARNYEARSRAARHSADIIRKLITRGTENRDSIPKPKAGSRNVPLSSG